MCGGGFSSPAFITTRSTKEIHKRMKIHFSTAATLDAQKLLHGAVVTRRIGKQTRRNGGFVDSFINSARQIFSGRG